jgi:predicted aminopeptidase
MGHRVTNTKPARILLVLGFFLFGSGCRLTYLFHAASGQFRLLNGAIPMEKALKQTSLSPAQKERLRMVARIKSFGEQELGLKKTRSYETVYLSSRQNLIYAVSASPKDRLSPITWWFPVVGDVPYLGFFDLERAKAEKAGLLRRDLDVVIGVADAYSTLGWFRDPVTLNLIRGSVSDLVEILLHEMTHATLYVKGQGEFNEGLAVLVGKVGAYGFLRKYYGAGHPQTLAARKSIEDERIFASYLESLLQEIQRLYDAPLTFHEKLCRREQVFDRAIKAFEALKPQLQTDRFVHFGKGGLNNAYLLSVGLYHRHFHLFESVLQRMGGSIREMIALFKHLSTKDQDMLHLTRKWLSSKTAGPPAIESRHQRDWHGHREALTLQPMGLCRDG